MTNDKHETPINLEFYFQDRTLGFKSWKAGLWERQELARVKYTTDEVEALIRLAERDVEPTTPAQRDAAKLRSLAKTTNFGSRVHQYASEEPTPGKFLEFGTKVHEELERWLKRPFGIPTGLGPENKYEEQKRQQRLTEERGHAEFSTARDDFHACVYRTTTVSHMIVLWHRDVEIEAVSYAEPLQQAKDRARTMVAMAYRQHERALAALRPTVDHRPSCLRDENCRCGEPAVEPMPIGGYRVRAYQDSDGRWFYGIFTNDTDTLAAGPKGSFSSERDAHEAGLRWIERKHEQHGIISKQPIAASGCFCDVHGSGHMPGCKAAETQPWQDDTNPNVWVSADGRRTLINELGNRHLVNIMRLMDRGERGLSREGRQWPLIVAEVVKRSLPHGVLLTTDELITARKTIAKAQVKRWKELKDRYDTPSIQNGRTSSTQTSMQSVPRDMSWGARLARGEFESWNPHAREDELAAQLDDGRPLQFPFAHSGIPRLRSSDPGSWTMTIVDAAERVQENGQTFVEFVLQRENGEKRLFGAFVGSNALAQMVIHIDAFGSAMLQKAIGRRIHVEVRHPTKGKNKRVMWSPAP